MITLANESDAAAQDGTVTESQDAKPPEGAAPAPDAIPLGPMLDEPDEAKVCKLVEREIKARASARDHMAVVAERNALWRQGYRNLQIVAGDGSKPFVRFGFGSKSAPPAPGKTDDLIRKTIATLLVDEPVPECEPATDEDADRDAADLSTRILKADQKQILRTMEMALDKGGHWASAFVHTWIDPKGGGWEPLQVEAHPRAATMDDATTDPATGLPAGDGLILRYVRPDGSLSDEAVGAQMRWLPGARDEVLTPDHVILLPETCTGIEDADGVIVLRFTSLGALKGMYERVAEMSEDELRHLVTWRPPSVDAARLTPAWLEGSESGRGDVKVVTDPATGKLEDHNLVLAPIVYFRSHGTYPKGARVVVGGGRYVLDRQPWCATIGHEADAEAVAGSNGAGAREECLDIPLAQYRWLVDTVDDNPMGIALATKLGPSDEVSHTVLAGVIEYLYNFNNRITYLPQGSTVQPGQLARARRNGDPIFFNPGGKPELEQPPPFPGEALAVRDVMQAEMDSAANLEAPAQGATDGSVKSGRHASQLIEQSLTAMSSVRQNALGGFLRQCRVRLQQYRAFVTGPQILRFAGEGGARKRREWQGTDLRGTKDVNIARGTFTLLSKSAKKQLAREEFELGMAAQDPNAYANYRRATSGNVDPLLGLEEDRHAQRVRKQIAEWSEGPTEEMQAMAQQVAMAAAQQAPMWDGMVDPATGAPVQPQVVSPLTEAAAKIFAPLPVDDEPTVAWVRHQELARAMAGSKFGQFPPEWQEPFVAAYHAAKYAAGIQTVAEQAAAAQQQQQMQMQQQQAEAEGKASEGAANRDARAQELATKEQGATDRAALQADVQRSKQQATLVA